MRRIFLLVLVIVLGGCRSAPATGFCVVETELQEVKGRQEFGRGPLLSKKFLVLKTYPEPLFVTGFSMELADQNGEQASPAEWVDWWEVKWVNHERHSELLGRSFVDSEALVRADSGTVEVKLPEGYGLPMMSNEPLYFQVSLRDRAAKAGVFEGKSFRAKLRLDYTRATAEEGARTPLVARDFWVGDPASKTTVVDPEPWLLLPGEKNKQTIAPAESVVLQSWVVGPGMNKEQLQVALPERDQVSALGFVAFEQDKELEAWPKPPR